MNQVLKGGPHVPNNQLYQTLGVPVAIWGRGGPKPVWVGTWPAGRRGAASTGLAVPVEYVFRSGKKTRRRVGYPPNLIKLLGRPHPTSMGGETEQSGAV